MPKFPGLSGAELVAALEKLGFSKARQSGSHIVMRRASAGCVVSSYRLTDSEGRKKLDVTRILEVRPESHVCAVETQAHVQELFSVMRRDLRQLIFHE